MYRKRIRGSVCLLIAFGAAAIPAYPECDKIDSRIVKACEQGKYSDLWSQGSACYSYASSLKRCDQPAKARLYQKKACDLGNPGSCMDLAAELANQGKRVEALALLRDDEKGCGTLDVNDTSFWRAACLRSVARIAGERTEEGRGALISACEVYDDRFACEMLQAQGVRSQDPAAAERRAGEYQRQQAEERAEIQRERDSMYRSKSTVELMNDAMRGSNQQTRKGQYTPPVYTPSAQRPSYGSPQTPGAPPARANQPRRADNPNSCQVMNTVVTVRSEAPRGAGHCDGETVIYMENRSGESLSCFYVFHKGGRFGYSGGLVDLKPYQKTGGEKAGMWACSTDTGQIEYACYRREDAERNSCGSTTAW